MSTISILITLCALAGSSQEKLADAPIQQDAMRLGLACVASGTDEPPKASAVQLYGEVEEPRLRARRDRIREEIERLGDHDWAGTYSFGGVGLNVTIDVAPQAGVVYTWSGCLGLYDLNHGEITEVTPDRIRLDLAIDSTENKHWSPVASTHPFMSDEWIIVRWGEQRFMVPTAQMIDFCNSVSRVGGVRDHPRRKPRRGVALAPFERPVGFPEVPAEYRPFLLSEPLTGSILSREEPTTIGTRKLVRARIDLGQRDGLLPGMVIDADIGLLGEVVAVQEQTATVEFRFAAWRNGPMQGWSIRTGPLHCGTR